MVISQFHTRLLSTQDYVDGISKLSQRASQSHVLGGCFVLALLDLRESFAQLDGELKTSVAVSVTISGGLALLY